MTNTVHAGAIWYSEEKSGEIETCLNCPLPDCKPQSIKCPLFRAKQQERAQRLRERDMRALITAWWAKTAPDATQAAMSDNKDCQT